MTRKHFNRIAAALNEAHTKAHDTRSVIAQEIVAELIEDMQRICAESNGFFDHARFHAACTRGRS